ncbi:MAG: gamma carbonic anhydrase family protein [Bradyrhizobium sp.]
MPVYALGAHEPALPPPGKVWIAPDAQIIGRVSLGEDSGIWFGAILRGDNELILVGPQSNIQDGAILHTDMGFPLTIGRACTIGHRAILHGCTIGDGSLIGMAATVMNGARIGSNCIVGANALVTENKSFPDNSLILGSPAKAVRTLDPAALEMLKRAAPDYVANAQRFRTTLRRVD